MRAHPSLAHLDHRPWPLPAGPWSWRQAWHDLAFIHYRVDRAALQARLPEGVTVQEFDGSAWIGVVPFMMADVMRGSLPALPGISSFPELNVRTYVEAADQPGVWFFSLDAASAGIVFGGRYIYQLPYYLARMSLRKDEGGWYDFSSSRYFGRVDFTARYRPRGEVFHAAPGSFEHFVAERYCLYSKAPRGPGLSRVEVHHAAWPLQRAEVEITRNDLFAALGMEPPAGDPVCHFTTGVSVVSWGGVALPVV